MEEKEPYPGLTIEQSQERDRLIELQKDKTRWFTKEEFDRLKELEWIIFKEKHKLF